jgi:hypothetical protein
MFQSYTICQRLDGMGRRICWMRVILLFAVMLQLGHGLLTGAF